MQKLINRKIEKDVEKHLRNLVNILREYELCDNKEGDNESAFWGYFNDEKHHLFQANEFSIHKGMINNLFYTDIETDLKNTSKRKDIKKKAEYILDIVSRTNKKLFLNKTFIFYARITIGVFLIVMSIMHLYDLFQYYEIRKLSSIKLNAEQIIRLYEIDTTKCNSDTIQCLSIKNQKTIKGFIRQSFQDKKWLLGTSSEIKRPEIRTPKTVQDISKEIQNYRNIKVLGLPNIGLFRYLPNKYHESRLTTYMFVTAFCESNSSDDVASELTTQDIKLLDEIIAYINSELEVYEKPSIANLLSVMISLVTLLGLILINRSNDLIVG